jgi:oligopeptidase B
MTPISPMQTLELDITSLELKHLHTEDAPNFDADNYVAKREYAKARDGQMIPLTIVHKKGIELNGENPAFVYAYGSYGYGIPPYFSPARFSLADRGFVYCLAHIRGGDTKGNAWYLDGKMRNKMNTFNDFIDSCEHLIDRKYTSKGEIAINGASAGGLLMGAVTNMRPDLFKAVIAGVAFVDVINTISDDTLPLTPPEWEEWGNPIKNKGDFEYMMQYSPYDNVSAKEYPAMLYNSGISDEQVTYWEPTKMVAKLAELKTDENPLLLNMKMHAGHAGASKKYEAIKETAFDFSFVLKSFNMR